MTSVSTLTGAFAIVGKDATLAPKIDRPLIVISDHTGDSERGFVLTQPSAQMITMARQITSGPIYVIALNPAPAISDLGALGVDTIFIPDLAGMSPRVPAVVADAALACLAEVEPAALLCVSNARGREVAARLAITLGSGAAVEVTNLGVRDCQLVVKKTVLSGTWETTFQVTKGIPVIAINPSACEAHHAEQATTPQLVSVGVKYSDTAKKVKVRSSVELAKTTRPPLTEARVVVCGGRGTDGDFGPVEALADALGGAVGATRVASDEGWVDHSLQIGQTGVTIAPKVYIGLGVSGALHHTCAIQSAQQVVAVCDDPDAPIFQMCDFGVVGDLRPVVAQTLSHLREE